MDDTPTQWGCLLVIAIDTAAVFIILMCWPFIVCPKRSQEEEKTSSPIFDEDDSCSHHHDSQVDWSIDKKKTSTFMDQLFVSETNTKIDEEESVID